MNATNKRNLNIEILEPLLLMSASQLDCDAWDVATETDGNDVLMAFNDGEHVNGGNGDDILSGLGGNNVLNGGSGDDILIATQGGNAMNGGTGQDKAVYSGRRADYVVEDHGFGIVAVRNGACVDYVSEVEEIQFNDGRWKTEELIGGPAVFFDAILPADETDLLSNTADDVASARVDSANVTWTDDNTVEIDLTDASEEPVFLTIDESTDILFDFDTTAEILTEDVWFPAPDEILDVAERISLLQQLDIDESGHLNVEEMGDLHVQVSEEPGTSLRSVRDLGIFRLSTDVTWACGSDQIQSAGLMDVEVGGSIEYCITGEDAAQFRINSETGEMCFNDIPNSSEPRDADGNNIYEVILERTIGEKSLCQVVQIAVCDQYESSDPAAQDDTKSTFADTSVCGTVAENDSDADGDELTFKLIERATNGVVALADDGSYTYTPRPGFTGTDTFWYQASDDAGGCDIAEVTVTILPVPNESPQAIRDYYTTEFECAVAGNVIANDIDPDGDTLTATLLEEPANGRVEILSDGQYIYTPDSGFSGYDTFLYQVCDGNGGTTNSEVCIEVCSPVNLSPDAQDDVVITETNTPVVANVLDNDSDPDGGELSVYLVDGPSNGSITMKTNGEFSYSPDPGFYGADSFSYEIVDRSGESDVAYVKIEVEASDPPERVNQTPIAEDDHYETNHNEAVSGNVLENDSDPDGDTIHATTLTDVRTSEGGTVTLYLDGSFVYQPADGFCGTDSFVYELSDCGDAVTTATVQIQVSELPEVPVADTFKGDSEAEIKGNVILNDTVTSSDTEVTLVSGPANGTLKLNADGTFCYLANDGFCGHDTFTYSLVKSGVVSNETEVRLVVAEVQYDTTYVGSGNDGLIWGDPHFRGDDGGLFDVQGEADHVYNLLSDADLQVNARFIYWQGIEHDGTVIGELGATIGDDQLHVDFDGARLNGEALQIGETRTPGSARIEYDGTVTTLTTAEYRLQFTKQDGLFSVRIQVIDPFSDLVAPHGLWGQTVDGDAEARNGDFYKDNYDYGLQGGGAIDRIDNSGNVVRSERGDDSSFRLYETSDLFSTEALYSDGEAFFRFHAERGTGLSPV